MKNIPINQRFLFCHIESLINLKIRSKKKRNTKRKRRSENFLNLKAKVNQNWEKTRERKNRLKAKIMIMIDIREKRKEKKEKIEEIKMKRTKDTINLNHVAIRRNDHITRDDRKPSKRRNVIANKRIELDANSVEEAGFKREKHAF